MLEILTEYSGQNFSHNTLAVKATELVSATDYKDILVPAIEAKLQDHASIKLWYQFDKSFAGLTVGALWDDFMIGLFHLTDFSRLAIISDDNLIRSMVAPLSGILPCDVAIFNLQEARQAKVWLDEIV